MVGKIAFLYAGQGSQRTGMGKDLYEEFPKFREVFDSIKLDFDVKEACFDNPDNILQKTQYTQPCMVAFACGITNALKEMNIVPDYACGLSLGEYSALYAAEVWSLEDTMKIIAVRGAAMAEASEGIDSSMVAITSLDPETVSSCCLDTQDTGIVSVCNINCPGQVVIGGDKKAVEKAVQLVKEKGARRCIPLAVSGPFHTQYMKPAGVKLDGILKAVKYNEPVCEVFYNYTGGPKDERLSVRELLIKQIKHTVRFQDCIENLIETGVRTFVEIGPGTALSGFVKKVIKALNLDETIFSIHSINSAEDLTEVVSLFGCRR